MTPIRWRKPGLAPSLALFALACIYLLTVLPNLADDPIVGGDEGWIMSASAKWAAKGAFGSDLFAGFYGVEHHYFFNLPLHHLLLAVVFDVFGAGVLEARFVSVIFGLLALVLTYALGRRIGGEAAGVGAGALLVLLRLNLAPFSGLTLTDLGATVRYDLIAVPFGVGAALLVCQAGRLQKPVPTVALAGLLLGLAALTQFIGAFFALPLVLFLFTEAALSFSRRLMLALVLGGVALLAFVPYGVYIADHWQDFRGQARAVEQETGFLSPAFYWRQLTRERDRYAISVGFEKAPDSVSDATSRPSARLAMLLLAPIATVYTVIRASRGSRPHRLLAFMLVGLVVQLALFESTKRFVYWVVVVPFLCVAIADLALAAWRCRSASPRPGLFPRVAVAVVVLIFAVEGIAVAARDVRDAPDPPDYAVLAGRLDAALPPGASAMGDNRLWPALRERDYRSLLLLFYHTNPRISKKRTTDVYGAMDRIGVDYLLLSPLGREILTRLSPRDGADFERFLRERGELTSTVRFPDYGPIDIYRLNR